MMGKPSTELDEIVVVGLSDLI
ncbi:hypothetical protein HALA3H3_620033 [Halomonas sp. A3H3]|nr:hypothetical protein HALA3H3_620033 [Halomonas sp. A3H3]